MMYAFRSCLRIPDEAICPVSADLLKFYFLTIHFKYVVSVIKLNLNWGHLTFFSFPQMPFQMYAQKELRNVALTNISASSRLF